MNLGISRELYDWYAGLAPYLVGWTAAFTLFTTVRIVAVRRRSAERVPQSAFLTEVAALPLTVAQLVGFWKAVVAGDALSILLFVWWGPGFWLTLLTLLLFKLRGRKVNWRPLRYVISWLCKLNYLAFLVVFLALGRPELAFVFSAWILNDQYGMAYLCLDADRLRRSFDDRWFVRLCYPAGLFAPFFFPAMPSAWLYRVYGPVLFALWISGISYVFRRGLLRTLPDDPTLLRNMVYFADRPDAR